MNQTYQSLNAESIENTSTQFLLELCCIPWNGRKYVWKCKKPWIRLETYTTQFRVQYSTISTRMIYPKPSSSEYSIQQYQLHWYILDHPVQNTVFNNINYNDISCTTQFRVQYSTISTTLIYPIPPSSEHSIQQYQLQWYILDHPVQSTGFNNINYNDIS